MKGFLDTALARRTAWMVLVAVVATLAGPVAQRPATAQTQEPRSAYLVEFTAAEGQTVEKNTLAGVTKGVRAAVLQYRDHRAVRRPLELLPVGTHPDTGAPVISATNPIVKRALEEKALDPKDLETPPTTAQTALDLARNLGLDAVIVGTLETKTPTKTKDGKGLTTSIGYTVIEYPVVANPGATLPPASMVVTETVSLTTTDEKGKLTILRDIEEMCAQQIAARLLAAPALVPTKAPEVVVAKKGMSLGTILGIVGGCVAVGAGLFVISSIRSAPKENYDPALAVSGVTALSEQDSVRVSWSQAAGAIGYTVYRRAVSSQPIRTRAESGFTALPNPQTSSFPTILGGNRLVFIDTTAVNGQVYEYAVAGIGADMKPGRLSDAVPTARTGPNIAASPTLRATAGNGFVSLSWTPNSSFNSGYYIFRHQGSVPNTAAGSADQVAIVGPVTDYDDRDTQLVNNVTYYYVVQPYVTVNGTQKLIGNDSNQVAIAPSPTARPQQTRNVGASADVQGRVTVTWLPNAEPNIASYEILRRRDASGRALAPRGRSSWLRGAGGALAGRVASAEAANAQASARGRQVDMTGFTVVGTAAAAQSTFTEGPLLDGSYTYAVRAVNTSGVRGLEGLSNAVTVQAPPAAPTGLTARGIDNAVVLGWNRVTGNLRGYRLYRSLAPIDASMTGPATAPGIALVTEVGPSVITYTDSGVLNNTTVYYAITAVTSAGVESLFGKGAALEAGVVAVPHAAPATMTLGVDRSLISANGKHAAVATARVADVGGNPAPGVEITLTTNRGLFASPLPANTFYVDSLKRQVRGVTDTTGQLRVPLSSEVITVANTEIIANLQARSGELPTGQQVQSLSVTMKASVPSTLIMSPITTRLNADLSSTTELTAKVFDSLLQPVPDNAFSVAFTLSADNGEIRRAGDPQLYPFQRFPTTVLAPVSNGQASLVYRAGRSAGTVVVGAAVSGMPGVASQSTIVLAPGTPTQIGFAVAGTPISRVDVPIGGQQTVTVTIQDAQGNAVGAGVTVAFTVDPTGAVTVPSTATTDANGQVALSVVAGATVADAVIAVSTGDAQSQLPVRVR